MDRDKNYVSALSSLAILDSCWKECSLLLLIAYSDLSNANSRHSSSNSVEVQPNQLRKSFNHEFRRTPIERFPLIFPSSMSRRISRFSPLMICPRYAIFLILAVMSSSVSFTHPAKDLVICNLPNPRNRVRLCEYCSIAFICFSIAGSSLHVSQPYKTFYAYWRTFFSFIGSSTLFLSYSDKSLSRKVPRYFNVLTFADFH